jgi:esterase/lipase superfamily enzyme
MIVQRPWSPRARACGGTLVAILLLAAVVLAGCDSPDVARPMMPAPIIMKDPRLDFTRLVAPQNRNTDVRVLYATSRTPAQAGDSRNYLQSRTGTVRLGLAQVHLGQPGWSFADLVESDRTSRVDTPRPATVTSVERFGEIGGEADRAFVDAVDRQVESSRTGEAVIYVPGYRVSFNQVMTLMGAWAHYLGRSSAVVAFSWPTGTRVWNYFIDCRRARADIPDIERLVTLVAERSRARRLNLIAFSCGSPLLAEALVNLRNRHPEEDAAALQRRYRIGNAIFVAADIDLRTFTRSQLPALSDIAVRTQVYVSEDDAALKWAARFAGASRLGRPSAQELTRADFETIASNERLVGIDVAGVYGAHGVARTLPPARASHVDVSERLSAARG